VILGRRQNGAPQPPPVILQSPPFAVINPRHNSETGMLFVLIAIDKENSLALRMETRAAHFEYAKATDVVRMGGPFLDAKGDMAGSMLVFEAADMEAAKHWAANDPYAKAGLFARSEIRSWKLTFNPNNIQL
jgi:hypothetical protein